MRNDETVDRELDRLIDRLHRKDEQEEAKAKEAEALASLPIPKMSEGMGN